MGWLFFFFKQKTAYEILTCDWSSDVCSSDLGTGYLLERLSTVQLSFVDLPNREATYYNKADEFEAHSARLAETGKMVIQNSSVQSKQTIDMMNNAAKQVNQNMACHTFKELVKSLKLLVVH